MSSKLGKVHPDAKTVKSDFAAVHGLLFLKDEKVPLCVAIFNTRTGAIVPDWPEKLINAVGKAVNFESVFEIGTPVPPLTAETLKLEGTLYNARGKYFYLCDK